MMQELRQLSFDMYQKYALVASWIDSFRTEEQSFSILEVGGRGELLNKFLPNDQITILDNEPISDSPNFILGDAINMPFAENSFDFVISTDVLEHIPHEKRKKYISEHVRVARIGATIIAPFSNKFVSEAETNINIIYRELGDGTDYRWLSEHKLYGLPTKNDLETWINELGYPYKIVPFGYIPLWVFMLNLSHCVVFFHWQSQELYSKFNKLNQFYNTFISPYDRSSSENENYRFAIYINKMEDNNKENNNLKEISEVPYDIWYRFSELIWDLLTCLIKYKNEQLNSKQLLLEEQEKSLEQLKYLLSQKETEYQYQVKQIEHMNKAINELNSLLEKLKGEKDVLVDEYEHKLIAKEESIDEKEREIQHLKLILVEKEKQIQYYHFLCNEYASSTSWKLTRPLRALGRIARNNISLIKKSVKCIRKKINYFAARKVFSLIGILNEPTLQQYDTISFDLFDTLVFRKVDPPELVHRHTAQFVSELLKAEGIPINNIDLILDARYGIEHELRHKTFIEGGDYECTFSDIIYGMLEKVGGEQFAKKYVSIVKNYELNTELAVIYANPEAIDALQKLKTMGMKIIVVSDMYLEKEELKKILDSCGLVDYIDEIYVSSQYGLCKGTGRLFKKLQEQKLIKPSHTIHVGDNYISDYRMPNENGIKAYWYISKGNIKRKTKLRKTLLEGDLDSIISQILDEKQTSANTLFNLGKNILGPIFTLYVEHVIQKVTEKKVDEVFFLAREGYLFQKIYNRLKQMRKYTCSSLPEGKYLYISRLSSSLPSVYRFGFREIRIGLWKMNQQGLTSILSTFNLNPSEFKEYAKIYGFTNMKEPIYDPFNDIRLHNFIDDYRVQEKIQIQKEYEKELLYKYLDQLGFFGENKKCVFVDIGWSGTIQHNVGRAFINEPNFPHLIGIYFGRNYDYHLRYIYHPKLIFEAGFAYDFEQRPENYFVVEFPQLFEQAATAPHGSTIGYKLSEDGQVQPILKQKGVDREQEKEQRKFINQIQEGIMAFVEQYCHLNDFFPVNQELAKSHALKKVRRFILFPTKEDVKAIEKIYHSEDWGTSNVLKIISPVVSKKMIFQWRKLKQEINDSFWKQGTIKKLGIPGLISLYNWKKYRKIH